MGRACRPVPVHLSLGRGVECRLGGCLRVNPWALLAVAAGALTTFRWRRQRMAIEGLRETLRQDGELTPNESRSCEQLSAGLRALFLQARSLRALLEGPLTTLAPPLWAETPWARRERCNAWDLAVVDLRRAAWEWRLGFARLDEAERRWLRGAGLHRVPLTGLLVAGMDRTADPWEQVVFASAPDPAKAGAALREAAAELARFERMLLGARQTSYRRPA